MTGFQAGRIVGSRWFSVQPQSNGSRDYDTKISTGARCDFVTEVVGGSVGCSLVLSADRKQCGCRVPLAQGRAGGGGRGVGTGRCVWRGPFGPCPLKSRWVESVSQGRRGRAVGPVFGPCCRDCLVPGVGEGCQGVGKLWCPPSGERGACGSLFSCGLEPGPPSGPEHCLPSLRCSASGSWGLGAPDPSGGCGRDRVVTLL